MALTLDVPPGRTNTSSAPGTNGEGRQARDAARTAVPAWKLGGLQGRLSRGESTFLLAQLSLVLETGTPLAIGLRQIVAQSEPRMRRVAEALLADLETGNTFTRALSHHPDLFSAGEVSMIQVGEAGGFMGDMMNRVVELRNRGDRMRTVVRGAVAYPAILLVVATAVIIFMLGWVFPKFEHVFDDMGTTLPLSTRLLLGTSAFLRHYGIWLLAGAGAAGVVLVRWMRSPHGGRATEAMTLSLPGIGPLLKQIALSHFFLNLGSLLQAKVPLLSALETVKGSLRLRAFRDLMDEIAEAAQRGEGIGATLSRSPLVPALARSIIMTGEETGRSDHVFLRLAVYYDEQVEKRLKTLSTLLEPILLIGMGGIVSFVVISLILPIFRMSRGVH